MKQFRKLAVALAAATAASILLFSTGSASGSARLDGTRTLQFLSVSQYVVDVPATGTKATPQIGGRLVFTNILYNRGPQFGKPTGAPTGRAEGVCTLISVSKPAAQCLLTAHAPDGQLIAIA